MAAKKFLTLSKRVDIVNYLRDTPAELDGIRYFKSPEFIEKEIGKILDEKVTYKTIFNVSKQSDIPIKILTKASNSETSALKKRITALENRFDAFESIMAKEPHEFHYIKEVTNK